MRRLLCYMFFAGLVCPAVTTSGNFAHMPVAGEVTVLNAKGRVVPDAEVVVYETIYDVSAGEARSKILSEKVSDDHGRATFDVMVEQARNTYLAARKLMIDVST